MSGLASGVRAARSIGGTWPPALWLAYGGLGAIGILIYFLLPSQGIQNAAYCLFGLGAMGSIGVGMVRYQPARRGAWALLVLGLALVTAGDGSWAIDKLSTGEIPFPSIADAFYLAGYAGLGVGLLLLTRGRVPGGDRATLIDATILMCGAGLLSWAFFMRPYLHDTTLAPLTAAVAVAYPLADVLLLGVLARLLMAPGPRVTSLWILGIAIGGFLVGDSIYAALSLAGTYQTGQLIDAAWLIGYVASGAFALHPSMVELGRPIAPAATPFRASRLVLLAVASLMAPLVIVVEHILGVPVDVPVISGVSALLFLLVLARLAIVIGDQRRTEASLRQSEVTLRQSEATLRQSDDALRASEARYRTLVEQASDGIISADPIGRLKDVNPAACALLGYSRDELLNLRVDDLAPLEPAEVLAQKLDVLHEGGTLLSERLLQRKDGSFVPVEINARMLPDGQFHGIIRDITERRTAQAERDRLAATIEQTSDFVMTADLTGTITYVNPAFTRTSGFEASRVLGHSMSELPRGPGNEAIDAAIVAALARGDTWSGTFHGARADGTLVELEQVISPMRDGSGAIVGSFAVGRDVSRERGLEAQLRQAQKMEAVGRLAGGIAHDFNNLLGAIRGYTELTHLASEPGDEIHDFSAEVLKAADRAKLLTQRLLTFARQQPAALEPVDLNEVVRGIEPMLRQIVDERTALTFELSPVPLVVSIDLALLEQAILNLVINARDAIPDCGSIRIESRFRTVENEQTAVGSASPPGRSAILRVSDTGGGIAPEDVPHLFEPFFTTKPVSKGTGLGLSIVYAAVIGARGTVTVDSTPGAGARFDLVFPITDQASDTLTLPPAPARPKLSGSESILLVEDEVSVRTFMSRILSRSGYRLVEAGSAEEALTLADTGPQPALLISDVLLPKASGPELAEALRARYPGLGVLFVSGYDADRLAPEGQFETGTAFLPKPFASDELLGAVRSVLDAPTLSGG